VISPLPENDRYVEGAKHFWRFHRRDVLDLLGVVAWIAGLWVLSTAVHWLAAHV
jgi:hypothetical protein